MTFGKFPALSAAKARDRASELHAKVRLGQDPAGEKESNRARAVETFEAVHKRYLTARRDSLKPTSYQEIERHLVWHCQPLNGLSFGKIDQRTIAGRLERSNRPVAGSLPTACAQHCQPYIPGR